MQPTDFRVRSVFVSRRARRPRGGTSVAPTKGPQGLVAGNSVEDRPMNDRLMRVLTALGAVAALALAGGASLRGF